MCNKVNPVDTEHKLNVHKTLIRRPGRLLNVSFTFNLGPVSTGKMEKFEAHCSVLKSYVMCKISALVQKLGEILESVNTTFNNLKQNDNRNTDILENAKTTIKERTNKITNGRSNNGF